MNYIYDFKGEEIVHILYSNCDSVVSLALHFIITQIHFLLKYSSLSPCPVVGKSLVITTLITDQFECFHIVRHTIPSFIHPFLVIQSLWFPLCEETAMPLVSFRYNRYWSFLPSCSPSLQLGLPTSTVQVWVCVFVSENLHIFKYEQL